MQKVRGPGPCFAESEGAFLVPMPVDALCTGVVISQPGGTVHSIVMSMSVCLSVCLSAPITWPDFTVFLCM